MESEKLRTIGIIGGNGQMGERLCQVFRKRGCEVLVSDVDSLYTNDDIARESDIVIISVPIRYTEKVIRDVAPLMRSGALLTDVTSVKEMPLQVMQKYVAEGVSYVGGHPLFAPSTAWDGQNFILCKGVDGQHVQWYKDVLVSCGVNIIEMTAQEHDQHMAVIQCLTHFSAISLGSALEKMNYDLEMGESIATAVYQMRLYGVGRILAQDAMLYADIQKYNPYAKKVSDIYCEAVRNLSESISDGEHETFVDIFEKNKKYFGDMTEKSLHVTNHLINSMNTYE